MRNKNLKKNVLQLIKYHVNKDDESFIKVVWEIAKEFDESLFDGSNSEDYKLTEYIMALLSDVNTFSPMEIV